MEQMEGKNVAGRACPVRERIVEATCALIEESGGKVRAVTTRAIAARAGVGVGLINYHFQSKDRLIELCVQRVISRVVGSFQPAQGGSAGERLSASAVQVFEFLAAHPQVSRISILGEMQSPAAGDNSDNTRRGFAGILGAGGDEGQKNLLAFALTASLQAAFLAGGELEGMLGYPLDTFDGRARFVGDLVALLMGGLREGGQGR